MYLQKQSWKITTFKNTLFKVNIDLGSLAAANIPIEVNILINFTF